MTRRMDIDTSGWGPFDPNDPVDVMCERERLAFSEYIVKRLRKCPKTGSDEASIWTGAIVAIVQVVYAAHANTPPDSAREALHQAIDFAWLHCAAMATDATSHH